jgi:hypothetical protein
MIGVHATVWAELMIGEPAGALVRLAVCTGTHVVALWPERASGAALIMIDF